MDFDATKLLQSIPELILYFIPGFICVRLKEIYGFKKVHSKFTATVYSFLYSFLALIIYSVCLYLVKQIWPGFVKSINPELKKILKPCIFLLLGVLLGILITKLPKWGVGRKFEKWINKQYSPEETPWELAMALPYGGRFKVYLRNNVKYEGFGRSTTSDPGEPRKEILLHSYKKYERCANGEKWKCLKGKYRETYDASEYEMVLIKYEDVYAIEIKPITKQEYDEYLHKVGEAQNTQYQAHLPELNEVTPNNGEGTEQRVLENKDEAE